MDLKPLLTADEMRSVDHRASDEFGLPGRLLMERAGEAVARGVLDSGMLGDTRRALIVCGKGNNGGDGYVAARMLGANAVEVTCVLLGSTSSLKGDALDAAKGLLDKGVAIVEVQNDDTFASLLKDRELVVDAIFGTGLTSPPVGLHAAVIRAINASGLPVISVDIPSGVDASTGRAFDPSVRASMTVTMGAEKLGLRLHPGRDLAGRIEVADIGFPPELILASSKCGLIEDDDVRRILPARPPDGHKGTFGSVLVVAGSPGLCGAAVLAARGAARSGTGLVHLAFPESLAGIVEPGHVESVKHRLPDDGRGLLGLAALEPVLRLADSVDCVAIGPGIGTDSSTVRFLTELLLNIKAPVVLDADGINCLARAREVLTRRQGSLVLTPHPGEFARLTGDAQEAINAGRVEAARRFAREHNCVLVLKGAPTVVAYGGEPIRVNSTGNSGLASGGSGDVLTGLLSGLIAQGATAVDAAVAAAFLHGRAADIAVRSLTEYCLCAGDIVDFLPNAFSSVLAGP
jgi:NAD(P)H-hydrate epimerase